MGFLSGLADSATSLLGGDTGKPADGAKGDPNFVDVGPLGEKPIDKGGAAAIDHQNVLDPKMPIEFIHYGRVHKDVHDAFPHDALDDTKADPLQSAVGIHAIMFRAALEREAILRGGFISGCKGVLQEIKDATGGISDVIGGATSLLGGGGPGGNKGTDPASLDPYLAAITAAGGKINAEAILYEDIHKSGMDLEQARANYLAFKKKLVDGTGGSNDSLFGKLTDGLSLVPGAGDILKTVTGILFKMFDIYKGWYFKLSDDWEKNIEDASYNRSLEAITKQRYTPVFDVWSTKPDPSNPDPAVKLIPDSQKPNTGVKEIDKPIGSTIDDVNKGYNEKVQDLKGVEKKWKDFWETDGTPGPGQKEIDAAFANCGNADDLMLTVFKTALNVGDPPGFVKTAVTKLTAANVGMLQQIFYKLQSAEISDALNEDAFLMAGRKYIEELLYSLIKDLIPAFGMGTTKVPGSSDFGSFSGVNSGQAAKKGISVLDEELGKDIEPVLQLAMGILHDHMVKTRDDAKKAHSLVMEAYLAQLPLYVALMTRNTFFPVFQIIADKVFGAASGVGGMMTSPVKDLMNTGRKTAKDAKDKVTDLDSSIHSKADDVASSIDSFQKDNLGSKFTGDSASGLANSVGGIADSILGKASPADAAGGGSFPGDPRKTSGNGVDITKAKWDDVDQNQKVPITSKAVNT